MNVTFEVNMDDLDPDLEGFFDDVMKEVEGRVKQRTPVKTGVLRDAISVNKTDDTSYEIGADVDYFPFVEFGTSKMAGRFMVRTTIEEMPAIMERTEVRWKK